MGARGLTSLFSVFLALVLALPVAAQEEKKGPQNSGFLGDDAVYGRLEAVTTSKGIDAKRWIGPAMNFQNYQKVLVDDVVFYPDPEPGPQVSEETLNQIKTYLSDELRKKVGSVLNLADAPGAGVLRMETAITSVTVKTEGMKPYEVLPVAAVFGGLKAAAGKRNMDVRVFAEARYVDSQSGELLGAATRVLKGKDLKGKKDQLQLEDMRDSLDDATDSASAVLSEILAAPAQ